MVKKYAPETSQAEATAPIAINSPEVHWKPSKDFALSVCTDRLMRQKLPAEKESGSDLGDQESVNRHRLLMHGLVDFAGSPQVTRWSLTQFISYNFCEFVSKVIVQLFFGIFSYKKFRGCFKKSEHKI